MQDEYRKYIALVRQYIAEGTQRVIQQKALIAELARNGHDTANAKAFLKVLNQSLAMMYRHLETLTGEIYHDWSL